MYELEDSLLDPAPACRAERPNPFWGFLKKEFGREPFPGLLHALVLIWVIHRTQPMLAYFIIGPVVRREWYGLLPLALLATVLLASLSGPLLARFWGRRTFRDMMPLRPVSWKAWPSLVVGLLGVEILTGCLVLVMLQTHLVPMDAPTLNPGEDSLHGFLVAVIGAPLWEEFFFRGILLGGFLKRYPKWIAILASAILFGWSHGNLGQFVSAGVFGLFAGWIFAETGSLLPCILAHAFGNGIPESAAAGFGLRLGSWPAAWSWPLAAILLALGIAGLKRALRPTPGLVMENAPE